MDINSYKRYINLCDEISKLIETSNGLTDYELKSLLQMKKISFSDEEFFNVISNLLVYYGSIKRDDYWDKGAVYSYIENKHLHDSSYSRHYCSYTVEDNKNDKNFIVIADTHIGDEKLEDFKILSSLYDFAIKNNIKKIFHLGDLFTGETKGDFSKEEMISQLNSFIELYPKAYPWEIRTYSVIGNNDEDIHGFFQFDIKDKMQQYTYDLRWLNMYHPDFFVIPKEQFQITFSNRKFHFGHRLYIGEIRPKVKLFSLNDIKQEENWLSVKYDVMCSGHLHKGFIYTGKSPLRQNKDVILLGIPSTSKYNLGKVVAYSINLHYDEGNPTEMNVSFLKCDNNYNISVNDEISWNFNGNNKTYRKVL